MIELEASLRAVEPGWRFVKERQLAQAHRYLRDHGRRLAPSHRLPLILLRTDAEACGCFANAVFEGDSPDLVIVSTPFDRGLGDQPLARQYLHFWRLLYSLRIPTANAETVWKSLTKLQRREAEVVLMSSGAVLQDGTPEESADAFARDMLTHARFAASEMNYRYPALPDWPTLRSRLLAGFDETALYRSTRPTGASEPNTDPTSRVSPAIPPAPNQERAERSIRRAEAAAEKGNAARSAIWYTDAAEAGSDKARTSAELAISEGLVRPLASVMQWDSPQANAWTIPLRASLIPATARHWSHAAKALYDLQKIAVDLGGDLYAVDPAGWAASFGRRPLLRKLTLARLGLLHRRLLKVKKHLASAGLTAVEHDAIRSLLDPEIALAQTALRAAMEPIILRVFGEVGFAPDDIVERIALPKIVDELLDLTVAQGFFRFGDLRDALARNQLKMHDLAGVGELVFGDPLLKADAAFAERLDGLYYHGEIYLRWFQRGSSVAFGTTLGRWITLFVALPFGAAFMTVEFAKYIALEASAVARYVVGLFSSAEEVAESKSSHGIAMPPVAIGFVIGLGVLYLGLIHSTWMRKAAVSSLGSMAKAVRWVFAELPSAVWNSTPLKAMRRNPLARWFQRRLAVPLIGAGITAAGGSALGWPGQLLAYATIGTFAALALVLNTPGGQLVWERLEDLLLWLWRRVRTNFFPGLIGWIVWLFRELLGALDRLIYSIDEWFRFREGQSKPSLAIKIALGLLWFPVRYILRFAIYLLIEPQINPIKHFPVVTVSHKLLLPMIPAISTATGVAREWVAGAMSGIPGIFGFLAWELKENWRLYASNRPSKLVPLAIGHHGESVRGLLRPGFHSGTVPNAFASIRNALAKSEVSAAPAKLHKPLEKLHHVEAAMKHFAERDLLAYLTSTKAWAGISLRCEAVHLGLQHIRIEIAGDGPMAELRFELIDSIIVGHCDDTAFLVSTNADQRECWERAVLGFWAMGAVPVDDPRVNWDEWVSFWEGKSQPFRPLPL